MYIYFSFILIYKQSQTLTFATTTIKLTQCILNIHCLNKQTQNTQTQTFSIIYAENMGIRIVFIIIIIIR